MCDFMLPIRLDHCFTDVSAGAFFKSLDNDERAVFIERMENGRDLVVVVPPKEEKDPKTEPMMPKPSQYRVKKLKDSQFHKWLVLAMGSGEVLIP